MPEDTDLALLQGKFIDTIEVLVVASVELEILEVYLLVRRIRL